MRFGENHLPAAQRNAVMPSGDNEGEELDKLIFASRAFSFLASGRLRLQLLSAAGWSPKIEPAFRGPRALGAHPPPAASLERGLGEPSPLVRRAPGGGWADRAVCGDHWGATVQVVQGASSASWASSATTRARNRRWRTEGSSWTSAPARSARAWTRSPRAARSRSSAARFRSSAASSSARARSSASRTRSLSARSRRRVASSASPNSAGTRAMRSSTPIC